MNRIIRNFLLFIAICTLSKGTHAQDPLLSDSAWNFHFQFTGIIQYNAPFHSTYIGQNSFLPEAARAYSVTTTAFLGRKLWSGASVYFNPEMAGGQGLSSTLGIAGFPNGETFRIGADQTVVYVARIFIRQQFNLDKNNFDTLEDGTNQVKERVSQKRITLNFGKFGVADFFDQNSVSHDPRSDFMNWSLMNNGAYDYPANTRGYTYGLIAEYYTPGWVFRAGTALEPTYANGPTLNFDWTKTNSETVEIQKNYSIHKQPGAIRLLFYFNTSKAPAYQTVIDEYKNGTDTSLDVIHGTAYGGKKYGIGINGNQALSSRLNGFFRFGWNDGKTASWAFAEIDNSGSLGLRYYGIGKNRSTDNIGFAIVSNGISADHREFLNIGGYGFMIGDGKLPNYTRENIAELFYEVKLFTNLFATLDYQFVSHPAYNQDRGPVS
ncbi:MAG TPA: carbohydrate porin, partial [Puia sp.]|nr:carbohydrate porin [Puia sp.]